MGSLTSALLVSANSLEAFTRAMSTVENDVANVNTPGYAKQTLALTALAFDPAHGIPGGVSAGTLVSTRSEYLEQAVRNQNEQLGGQQQRAADLGQIQPLFDLNSKAGISGGLNQFFAAFSNLSVNPNDSASRQTVLDQAQALAQTFNAAATGITQVATNVDNQTRNVVASINTIAAQIAQLNQHYASVPGGQADPGLDAQAHAALEQLSEFANFTVLRDPNGAFNVYLGGQTPITIGINTLPVSVDFSAPQTAIRDAGGNDITSQITGGRLGALLEEKNTTLPGYTADLNHLAAGVADQVNTALGQGVDTNGAPGAGLFQYDAVAGAAFTLKTTGITPDQVAAATAAAPGGNANALAISQLGDSPTLGGYTFAQFFGNLGGRVGRDVATAVQGEQQSQDLVSQAQATRGQVSGVSLNEEAVTLLQYQRSYEAAAKMVTVIDELTLSLINMIPAGG
jgi:flagellar hook-associated protein 1 FlgK